MSGIGTTGVILIVLVALLLFGPSKLPELGRAFGRTLREFKNGAKDIIDDDDADVRKEVTAADRERERKEINDKRLPD
jgi:sec-independent protein translocase protein TatA